MKEYYVKIKPSCDNCIYECGVQCGPHEEPRWYCKCKFGYKNPLHDEHICDEFEFDTNIARPSVIGTDYFIRNKEDE